MQNYAINLELRILETSISYKFSASNGSWHFCVQSLNMGLNTEIFIGSQKNRVLKFSLFLT